MDESLLTRAAGALAAALAFAGMSGEAAAQSVAPSPLMRNLLTETPSARQYATPDGAVRFVFDRSSGGRVALVRFENDPEVHVLRPQGGAGGDEIYRTESGDVMLRLTPHGGLTVYTRARQDGMPAAEERTAEPLTPRAWEIAAYQARMRALQQAATRRLGRPVAFVAPAAPNAADAGVLVDAAERAAQGVETVRGAPIHRIVIRIAPRPSTSVQGDELVVLVAPSLGYAGRPSSTAIRNVVTRAAQGPER